ncbi:hypothetical protein SAMN05216312_103177 [Cohnella sp. OV330]|uniref:hypothetical protein n=1 Tax=Cohnella sp. OV330 TaxID=1855288 RepID=UPI0008E1CEC0|nr:hypothetical protein [Cohnella sp. OV330]SFB04572.1 hypothetical protein SAMN05216312_103177 [Cohnella sp. OV330]
MRKVLFSLAVIITLGVGYLYRTSVTYSINNSNKAIDVAIESFLNKGRINEEPKTIDIRLTKDIANKRIVLFTLDDQTGVAELSRGKNGKYKIGNVGYGTNWIRHRVIQTNNGVYYRAAGKREGIGRIRVYLGEETFDMPVGDSEYYITYFKLLEKPKASIANRMVVFGTDGSELARFGISKDEVIQ